MKTLASIAFGGAALALPALAAEYALDRVGEALAFSDPGGAYALRISGIVDLEYYDISLPAPGTIFTDQHTLFNPRASLFVDAQFGSRVYFFAQARIDHGFDPNDDGDLQCRLDECAIRVALDAEGRGSLQLGKFATVVGNWVQRHDSWENPFVTAPVPYENLTGIWSAVAARSLGQILAWAHVRPPGTLATEYADKYLRLPIIWGPSYTTGFAGFRQFGKFDVALELKNAALSSHPSSWDPEQDQWEHPTVSGRVGWRPNAMWNVGVSGSSGSYLNPSAEPTMAPGYNRGDYRQVVIGQDVSFAWHHWQLWAEWYANRFEIPEVGDAKTQAWYVETKYKFTPQFFGALRWNQQRFDKITDRLGNSAQWGHDLTRLDISGGYRFTPHVQLKLQYSFQHEDRPQNEDGHTFATQLTVRF